MAEFKTGTLYADEANTIPVSPKVKIKTISDDSDVSLETLLGQKSNTGHTHNYAGSSSAGGAATSANKLNTDAGSATQPVYFANGIPVKTTHTLGASVPSGAKFTDTTYSAATTSAAGLMSAADKTKLNGIATGANAYSHPTTSGNKHIPAGGSSGQILRWSADGTAVWGADNNTTYTFATGDSNGQIKVTPSGGSAQNVSVKGLGSAAYTASTAYATAAQGTLASNAMPKSGGTFTGSVMFDYSTYMKNGVFYNAYNTDGTACCILGVSTDDDLCVGSSNYAHNGDTVVISPHQKVILRAGEESGGTPASVYLCAEGAESTAADYRVLRWTTLGYERGYLQCTQDGVSMLGGPNHKWKNVYATNSAIQTSDRNAKTNIQDMDDRYVALFDLIRPVSYQMINGDRTHTGFIAQEVEEAMAKVGLTAEELGFFCKDIKTEIKGEEDVPVMDENGNPAYIYSLRYTEYIAIMAEKVRRLEAKYNEKLEKLENKIAELEAKLNA